MRHESARENKIDKRRNWVYLNEPDAGLIRANAEKNGGPIAQLVEPPAHNR